MLSALLEQPAFWGFLGAFIYAAGKLWAQLFGGEVAPTSRARTLAFGRFALACFFGPVAAAAFSMSARHFFGWAELRAVGFVIGLGVNKGWPIIEDRWLKKIGGPS